jgi:F0F1-type ATP synthase assembly protein I
MIIFGLIIGFVGVLLGFGLMLGGVWIRRKVWIVAKEADTGQESSNQAE